MSTASGKKIRAGTAKPQHDRRLPPLLRKAWYGLNQAFRRRIKKHAATPDQFTVLRSLIEAGEEGLSQRDICDLMASDPNTIAALVGRMEEMGVVARKINEQDKRALRVTATPKGRSVFKSLRATALKLQHDILATLSEKRREQFLEDLETVAAACGLEAEKK